ncbi:MAG: cyclic nucleotide-binding domain-containing protein [Magnetococcales bacterium]|nr:cyclic nucleotide-binding domain-containing protein [Magnetococcales bacterium]
MYEIPEEPEISDQVKQELLSDNFPGISPEDTVSVLPFLTSSNYQKDTMIFTEGDVSEFICIIVSGEIIVVKEDSKHLRFDSNYEHQIITRLHKGQLFGELAFIDELPRSASAVTVSETVVIKLDRDNFDKMRDEHPRLWGNFILSISKLVCTRLRRSGGALVDLRLSIDSALSALSN